MTSMGSHVDFGRVGDPAGSRSGDEPEVRTPSRWHGTSNLPDGTPIGRLGAYWYVLDGEGRAISDGYHEIRRDESGSYRGRRNARTERIVLDAGSARSTR
jgi:hypothetical protein